MWGEGATGSECLSARSSLSPCSLGLGLRILPGIGLLLL